MKAGGASLSIGSVRYWNGGAASQAKVLTPTGAGAGSCVNGLFANSAQPCASGVAAATCGEGDDEGSDGEQAGDQGGDQGADCVDGVDSTTHQSCDGGPAANPTDASTADEVGVPESNISDDLGCADEEDDDGEAAD